MTAIRAVVARTLEELQSHIAAWEALAREASEDNCFYEHWMLMPALRHLGESADVEIVLLYNGEKMVGVFPLQKKSKYKRVPVSHYQLWMHLHCYLCTPLVLRGLEQEVLQAFFNWLQSQARLLVWNWASEDGTVYRALESLSTEKNWTLRKTGYERAVLRGRTDGEEYLKTALSGKHRRDFGRLEKRLSEAGDYTYNQAADDTEAQQWLENFFNLEAGGWKGREGTDMKSNPGDREFMTSIVLSAFSAKRAILSFSKLDGKALACKVDFLVNKSSFSFKVAFDEEHSKFRPGLLLELWRLKMLSSTGCEFFDSCSMPGSIFDRLWADRRKIANVSIATRAFPEGLLVSAVPMAKHWLARFRELKNRKPEAQKEPSSAPSTSGESTESADSQPA